MNLDELFSRDPLKLTKDERSFILEQLTRQQVIFNEAKAQGKSTRTAKVRRMSSFLPS